jgi:hypothetical protein
MRQLQNLYRSSAIALILLVASVSAGCDSQEKQDDFALQASRAPNGFTATDQGGDILSEDEDDWRMSPFYFGKVRVSPVYPNPGRVDFVTVPINILQFDIGAGGFSLRAYEEGSSQLILLDRLLTVNGPGGYIMRFSPAILGREGLVRIFVFDGMNEIVSYGDLMIQN